MSDVNNATDINELIKNMRAFYGDPTVDYNSIDYKTKQLVRYLNKDIESCDITWSLFQSALNSYRCNSCVRPYPVIFYTDGRKDYDKMRDISRKIPNMKTLLKQLQDEKCTDDTVKLLHWVLVCQNNPLIKLMCNNKGAPDLSELYKYVSKRQLIIKPDYLFKFIYDESKELLWKRRLIRNRRSLYAFHGTRLDNIYSIYKLGLLINLDNNETLFGSGIYLSSELMISLTYAPAGNAWKKSMFGSNYSIVCLCEIIDHPKHVKCQDKTNKNRSINRGSIGGRVPDKYYVVLHCEYVRVRYLLLYKNSIKSRYCRSISRINNRLVQWIKKNKMIVLLLLYSLLLIFVGFIHSKPWFRIQRMIKHWFEDY